MLHFDQHNPDHLLLRDRDGKNRDVKHCLNCLLEGLRCNTVTPA